MNKQRMGMGEKMQLTKYTNVCAIYVNHTDSFKLYLPGRLRKDRPFFSF